MRQKTGSTHLSPEGLSCTSPTSWQRWLLGVPWQPDIPWVRPTYPSCWGRRGPSSRPSARWLFAGYLRRCSHLLVIGMHQAFLCNRARDRSVSIVHRRFYNRLTVSPFVRSIRRCTWFQLYADTFTRVNFLWFKNLFPIVLSKRCEKAASFRFDKSMLIGIDRWLVFPVF